MIDSVRDLVVLLALAAVVLAMLFRGLPRGLQHVLGMFCCIGCVGCMCTAVFWGFVFVGLGG